jgi:hypothetical protein
MIRAVETNLFCLQYFEEKHALYTGPLTRCEYVWTQGKLFAGRENYCAGRVLEPKAVARYAHLVSPARIATSG